MAFPQEYLDQIPTIYLDILEAYPRIDPARKKGYGLAVSTIYSNLVNENRPYALGEIREACLNMAASGVVRIQNEIFAHPTDLGEELIASLTHQPIPAKAVLPFPLPPASPVRWHTS